MTATNADYRGSWTGQPVLLRGEGSYRPDLKFQAYVDDNGLVWPWSSTRKFFRQLEDFPLAGDDVIVNGFPKSGTNWMQIMIANLYDDWETTRISNNRSVPQIDIPNAHNFEGIECCLGAEHRRLMKGHVARRWMPRRFREEGVGKVVHIYRNPKDSCISYFHELRSHPPMEFKPTLEEWVPQYVAGKNPFGSWLDHLLSWYRTPNALSISYEEVKRDPIGSLGRVAHFIGRPVSDARLAEVADKTDFKNMQSNEFKAQLNIASHDESISPFLRTGSVGGWRNSLSEEQGRLIDDAWGSALQKAGISIADM